MRLARFTLPLTLAAAAAVVGACFGDQVSPSTFRNTCDADGECREDERCIQGLCQLPCSQATFSEDCPSSSGYAACINGTCASLCELPAEGKKDPCSEPQTCVDLGFDLGGGGGGGGFGGGGSDVQLGVCAADCDANSCPDGEVCVEGFCAATCTETADCPTDLVCFGGICIPDLGGTTGAGGTGAGGSDTGTGGTGP